MSYQLSLSIETSLPTLLSLSKETVRHGDPHALWSLYFHNVSNELRLVDSADSPLLPVPSVISTKPDSTHVFPFALSRMLDALRTRKAVEEVLHELQAFPRLAPLVVLLGWKMHDFDAAFRQALLRLLDVDEMNAHSQQQHGYDESLLALISNLSVEQELSSWTAEQLLCRSEPFTRRRGTAGLAETEENESGDERAGMVVRIGNLRYCCEKASLPFVKVWLLNDDDGNDDVASENEAQMLDVVAELRRRHSLAYLLFEHLAHVDSDVLFNLLLDRRRSPIEIRSEKPSIVLLSSFFACLTLISLSQSYIESASDELENEEVMATYRGHISRVADLAPLHTSLAVFRSLVHLALYRHQLAARQLPSQRAIPSVTLPLSTVRGALQPILSASQELLESHFSDSTTYPPEWQAFLDCLTDLLYRASISFNLSQLRARLFLKPTPPIDLLPSPPLTFIVLLLQHKQWDVARDLISRYYPINSSDSAKVTSALESALAFYQAAHTYEMIDFEAVDGDPLQSVASPSNGAQAIDSCFVPQISSRAVQSLLRHALTLLPSSSSVHSFIKSLLQLDAGQCDHLSWLKPLFSLSPLDSDFSKHSSLQSTVPMFFPSDHVRVVTAALRGAKESLVNVLPPSNVPEVTSSWIEGSSSQSVPLVRAVIAHLNDLQQFLGMSHSSSSSFVRSQGSVDTRPVIVRDLSHLLQTTPEELVSALVFVADDIGTSVLSLPPNCLSSLVLSYSDNQIVLRNWCTISGLISDPRCWYPLTLIAPCQDLHPFL